MNTTVCQPCSLLHRVARTTQHIEKKYRNPTRDELVGLFAEAGGKMTCHCGSKTKFTSPSKLLNHYDTARHKKAMERLQAKEGAVSEPERRLAAEKKRADAAEKELEDARLQIRMLTAQMEAQERMAIAFGTGLRAAATCHPGLLLPAATPVDPQTPYNPFEDLRSHVGASQIAK